MLWISTTADSLMLSCCRKKIRALDAFLEETSKFQVMIVLSFGTSESIIVFILTGMVKIKGSKDDQSSTDFVERRKEALQKWVIHVQETLYPHMTQHMNLF